MLASSQILLVVFLDLSTPDIRGDTQSRHRGLIAAIYAEMANARFRQLV
jgi:hypothetical protein